MKTENAKQVEVCGALDIIYRHLTTNDLMKPVKTNVRDAKETEKELKKAKKSLEDDRTALV